MATLSLAMIVKNEEATIEQVVQSARNFCDEIIVVDTGSTDDTVMLAERAGATVYLRDWCDDFSDARNYSFRQCTKGWIIWLDADDVVTPECQEKIKLLMTQTDRFPNANALFMDYVLSFDAAGNRTFTSSRERILRNHGLEARTLKWEGAIHESIYIPESERLYVQDVWVEHRPQPKPPDTRNLDILNKLYLAGDRDPRNLFYYANELYDHAMFDEAAAAYKTCLEGDMQRWERYHTLRRLAQLAVRALDPAAAIDWALKAVAVCPARAEAYCELGVMFYTGSRWLDAIPFFHAACACTVDPASGFAEPPCYTYLPWDYLSICYDRLERWHQAVEAAHIALQQGHPDRDRIIKNIEYMSGQIARLIV